MADRTAIEWTDATWNPITGCAIVSKGCTNCYAMKLAGGRLRNTPSRRGLTRDTNAGPVWTGEVRLNEQWLDQPLRWARPRKIFVCAHGDLFAEGVPDEWIDRVLAIAVLAPQHTYQVLTKRPDRMRAYFAAFDVQTSISVRTIEALNALCARAPGKHRFAANIRRGDRLANWPLPNVWLGVSAEDQATADARIPLLLDTPAAVRFVSAEPLLGPIDFGRFMPRVHHHPNNDLSTPENRAAIGAIIHAATRQLGPCLDWIIVGGESGDRARPMSAAWARSIRDEAEAAGVPFLFKQWGSWIDADHWLAQLAPHHMRILVDGAPWRPAQPLNFSDAEILAKATGNRRFIHHSDGASMIQVGKAAAGRLLDGREWSEFPEARP